MSNAAKRGRPSKRDACSLNDEESTSDQPAEKSVKKEEESVASAQIVHLQEETKKEKSDLELENDALKAEIEKLKKEKAELQASPRVVEMGNPSVAVIPAAANDMNSGIIRFEVDDVSTIEEYSGRFSTAIEVGGLPWRAEVFRGDDELDVRLECMIKPSKCWSVTVDAEFILINSDRSNNVTAKEEMRLCHSLFDCSGPTILDDWEDLMDEDKGFINDDKINVEVHFSFTNMKGIKIVPRVDFTDPNEPTHDVALIIEGEKIYASKQYLSLHSPFFHTLFYGNFAEKNKKEIELKDVNREEFLELLRTMYPSYRKATSDSVENLLKLADRFQIVCVFELVEKCINAFAYELNIEDLPRIAHQYGLKIESHDRDEFPMERAWSVALNEPVNFTDPNEPRHDITLVIGGKKIYVSKQYLSLHSPFFKKLFYEEFRNDTEIELKGVNRQEFLKMLQVIYPSGKKITDGSAEYLLKLGTRFQVACVIERSEKYLLSRLSYEPSSAVIMETVRIADQYGLVGLLETLLNKLCMLNRHVQLTQFREIEKSTLFRNLSKDTTDMLVKWLLLINE